MGLHPQAAQFRADLVGFMANLMRQQRAPWQRADRADLPVPEMPYNGMEGVTRIFRSANAIRLIAAMQAHGWTDPRFVTAEQAAAAGWRVRGSGTALIFWQGLKSAGAGLSSRVTGDAPEAEIFRLFNAAEVIGMPARVTVDPAPSNVDMATFAQAVGGRVDRAQLLSSSALARRAAAQMLGTPERGEEWRHSLRLQLAGFLFARETGEYFRPAPEPVSQLPVTNRLLEDPDEFFRAARDAQAMAHEIAQMAQAPRLRVHAEPVSQARSEAGRDSSTEKQRHRSHVAPVPRDAAPADDDLHASRIFLAVPFAEITRAKAAGARWSKESKAWFVPANSNLDKVERWRLKQQIWDKQKVRDSFATAMASYGLTCPPGAPIDDDRWHYVPTVDAKGNQKKGAYILSSEGAVPVGYIQNFKGKSGPWRYDGEMLSPEVHAAYAAQAREQAILRERELRRQQRAIATRAAAVVNTLPAAGAEHGYLLRKGVRAHGLLLCNDTAQMQQLLNLGDFKTRGDTFLIVPGRDLDGNLMTIQAVAGRDGGGKMFTKGAAKKGAMHLIGAASVADLAKSPVVLFAEGYATAASLFENIGERFPVVTAFDAGNLVQVAKDLSNVLPATQRKLVCGDNDQFFVERVLDQIREVMPDLPETLTTGEVLRVQAGEGAGVREVFLGPVRADNEWHVTPHGKYRLAVVGSASLRVDVVKNGSDKHVQLVLGNKGRESAEEAAQILGGKAVLPAFSSLAGRPTDYNDLSLREGANAVQRFIFGTLSDNLVAVQNPPSAVRTPTLSRHASSTVKR